MKLKSTILRQMGYDDAAKGLPIGHYYELPFARHTEAMRADYEIGWRSGRDEVRKRERRAKSTD